MLDGLSPQRRRLVLAAVTVGVLLVLALLAAVAARALTTRDAAPQDLPGPVLLVPGYGGAVGSLAPLAEALRRSGREAVVVEPMGDGTGDLRDQARHLGQIAEQVIARSGAPSVDVVGYSAGGVVARLWARDEGGSALARRVLTIGSPQHGTSQAELGSGLAGGCPTACTQLVPGSDLLRRLNAGDETPAGPFWVTVRSTADRVVTPTGSAALDGALNLLVQDACPAAATSHGQLPGAPYTLAVLESALGVPAAVRPGRRGLLNESGSKTTQSVMSLVLKFAHAAREKTVR